MTRRRTLAIVAGLALLAAIAYGVNVERNLRARTELDRACHDLHESFAQPSLRAIQDYDCQEVRRALTWWGIGWGRVVQIQNPAALADAAERDAATAQSECPRAFEARYSTQAFAERVVAEAINHLAENARTQPDPVSRTVGGAIPQGMHAEHSERDAAQRARETCARLEQGERVAIAALRRPQSLPLWSWPFELRSRADRAALASGPADAVVTSADPFRDTIHASWDSADRVRVANDDSRPHVVDVLFERPATRALVDGVVHATLALRLDDQTELAPQQCARYRSRVRLPAIAPGARVRVELLD